MENQGQKRERIEPNTSAINLNPLCTRRQTLKWGGISIIGISTLGSAIAEGGIKPLIILEQAKGIVVADSMKCVGCGRCELACTEFNDGKAAPTISRIKVDRNLGFGHEAVLSWREGQGNWGNGLVVQDLCNQCPHPVPCANLCPENAIVVAPSTNARMVDLEKCTGCKICLKACPWEMISFDPETRKATKCHLCNGRPKCVEACPAGSLSYIPWRDLTDKIPPRITKTIGIPPERSIGCQECHLPGQGKNVSLGMGIFRGATKIGSPPSAREFGFRWIDMIGTILLPVALVFVGVHAAVRKVRNR
jgi:Fe-S-cluster-containing dehydrogenase component